MAEGSGSGANPAADPPALRASEERGNSSSSSARPGGDSEKVAESLKKIFSPQPARDGTPAGASGAGRPPPGFRDMREGAAGGEGQEGEGNGQDASYLKSTQAATSRMRDVEQYYRLEKGGPKGYFAIELVPGSAIYLVSGWL